MTIITFNDSYGASEVPFKARGARRQTSLLKLGNRMCQRLDKKVRDYISIYVYVHLHIYEQQDVQAVHLHAYISVCPFSICNVIYWFPLRSGHPSLLMLNRGLQEPIT